ncbi:hypothetical protein LCGC14_0762800 [marine sediment metagenome]|uniref:Uncharacterized protein n=1 Tax=marine sediment metagenome TaxID=412755 RepID=A0A0F9T7N7_9ZZZZ
MSGFVWYSFGSDVTGKKLAEALGYASGKKGVDFSGHKILLGWGCKPSEKFNARKLAQLVAERKLRIINPPASITANRDKVAFLKEMEAHKLPIPGYVASKIGGTEALLERVVDGIKKGTIMFPLVGHSTFHKGDPFFCHTEEDVRSAIGCMAGDIRQAYYFRSFCPGTEYRIHIFRDEALAAQCKVLDKDPVKACSEDLMAKLKKKAAKEEQPIEISEGHLEWVVKQMAGELLNAASHLQRSVKRGWTYSNCPVDGVPDEAISVAMAAMEAARLDLGAVSVVVDGKTARVTNIQTAPALTNDQLGLYVAAIRDFAGSDVTAKPSKKAKSEKTASRKEESAGVELISRLMRKLGDGVSKKDAEEALKTLGE